MENLRCDGGENGLPHIERPLKLTVKFSPTCLLLCLQICFLLDISSKNKMGILRHFMKRQRPAKLQRVFRCALIPKSQPIYILEENPRSSVRPSAQGRTEIRAHMIRIPEFSATKSTSSVVCNSNLCSRSAKINKAVMISKQSTSQPQLIIHHSPSKTLITKHDEIKKKEKTENPRNSTR